MAPAQGPLQALAGSAYAARETLARARAPNPLVAASRAAKPAAAAVH